MLHTVTIAETETTTNMDNTVFDLDDDKSVTNAVPIRYGNAENFKSKIA